MFKKILVLFVPFILIFSLNLGCDSGDDKEDAINELNNILNEALEEQKEQTFTAETKTQAIEAVFSLPDSLVAKKSNNSSKKSKNRNEEGNNDSGIAGIYSGVTHYIGMADEMGDMVKDIMGHMLDPDFIKYAPIGEIFPTEDDEEDEDAPKALKLEQGTDYTWKVTMFFDTAGQDIMGTIKFTISSGSINGEVTFITRDNENIGESETITITRKILVKFVKTTIANTILNTLEIKICQDLSPLKTYFDNHKETDLTEAQYNALDLGQPATIMVKATKDADDLVTIHGTSYHPYWGIDTGNFDADWIDLGNNRNMYLFKAVAQESETTKGAKIYLAFPTNNLTDLTNIWNNDSIGKIYGDVFLNSILTNINSDIAEDQTNNITSANYMVNAIRGETDFISATTNTPNNYVITLEEFKNFIDNPNTHEGLNDLKEALKSFSKIINPALFGLNDNNESTFLGTYDEEKDLYYKYSSYSFSDGLTPDSTEAADLKVIIDAFSTTIILDTELYLPNDVSTLSLDSIVIE